MRVVKFQGKDTKLDRFRFLTKNQHRYSKEIIVFCEKVSQVVKNWASI